MWLEAGCSGFSGEQSPPGGWLGQTAGPLGLLWAWKPAELTHSQVLLLPGLEPHFEIPVLEDEGEREQRWLTQRGLVAKILPKLLPAALPPKPGSVDTLHLPFLFLLLPQEAGNK